MDPTRTVQFSPMLLWVLAVHFIQTVTVHVHRYYHGLSRYGPVLYTYPTCYHLLPGSIDNSSSTAVPPVVSPATFIFTSRFTMTNYDPVIYST